MLHLLFALGLLAQTAWSPDTSREKHLERFFAGRPAGRYSREFLTAAEEYDLDWRLLPAIAMAESGGGKRCRGNNLFGWKNGNASFRDIPTAIAEVASSLAWARQYRGRGMSSLLHVYNPRHPQYRFRIFRWMRELETA